MRRWILIPIKILLAGGLIYWLIDSGRLSFKPLLDDPGNPMHLVGFFCLMMVLIICTLRWKWLLRAQGQQQPYRQLIMWNWIAYFFGIILPGSAGIELTRGYYLMKNTPEGKIAALSTLVMDRVFGLLSLLFLGGASFVVLLVNGGVSPDSPIFIMGGGILLIFLGAAVGIMGLSFQATRRFFLMIIPKRHRDSIETMVTSYLTEKALMFRTFLISLSAHILIMASFLAAGGVLGISLNPGDVMMVVPLVFIINYLPISPGGIGVGETAASFLFAQFGIMNGAALMLIVRVWLVLQQLSGGLGYLIYKQPLPKEVQEAEDAEHIPGIEKEEEPVTP